MVELSTTSTTSTRTVPTSFLLLHSPLVGPSTLRPLAITLQARGYETLCPDLQGHSTWAEITRAAVSATVGDGFQANVVVGHSGAGVIMANVARALDVQQLRFVDAVLPPDEGEWYPSVRIRSSLASLANADGILPPWNTWWNPNMMRRLVPDDDLRSIIEFECQPTPLSLYDNPALQPQGWSSPESCVYIRLSGAYSEEANDARHRGWMVLERSGNHLDAAADPGGVADLIERSLKTTRIRVGDLDSLRRRGGVTVPRNAPSVLVIAPPNDAPFAVENQCAHQGAELLAGYVSATDGAPWIECPLHSWRFDLATGLRLIRGEPSTDPQDVIATFPVAVDTYGVIWVEVPAPPAINGRIPDALQSSF